MKNLNNTKQTPGLQDDYKISSLEFGDVVVYNEMADQTVVKLNLIDQMHLQFAQIEEMTLKRQFMMKDILQLIGE